MDWYSPITVISCVDLIIESYGKSIIKLQNKIIPDNYD
jgi:hypothetical protein